MKESEPATETPTETNTSVEKEASETSEAVVAEQPTVQTKKEESTPVTNDNATDGGEFEDADESDPLPSTHTDAATPAAAPPPAAATTVVTDPPPPDATKKRERDSDNDDDDEPDTSRPRTDDTATDDATTDGNGEAAPTNNKEENEEQSQPTTNPLDITALPPSDGAAVTAVAEAMVQQPAGVVVPGTASLPTGMVPGATGMVPGATGMVPGATGMVPGATGMVPGAMPGGMPGATGMPPGLGLGQQQQPTPMNPQQNVNPNEMMQQQLQQQQGGASNNNNNGMGGGGGGGFGAGNPLGQAVALREMQLAQLGMGGPGSGGGAGGGGGMPDNNAAAMQQHLFNQQLLMAGGNPFAAAGHHHQAGQLPLGFGGNPAFGQLGMASFLPGNQQQQQQQQQQRFPGGGHPQQQQQQQQQQQGGGMPGQPRPPDGQQGGGPPQQQQQQQQQQLPQDGTGGPPGGGVPGNNNNNGGPMGGGPPQGHPGMPGGMPGGGDPAAFGYGSLGPRGGGFLPGMGGFPGGGGMPQGGNMQDANSFQQQMMAQLQHHQAGAAGLGDPNAMLRQRMMLGMPPGAGGFRPSFLAAAGGRINNMSAELRGLASLQPQSPAMSLSLACDDEHLSEYQIMVRKQLEVFEAQPEDVESNTQGRKKQVALGQVGIRCKHCASLPLRQRGRGAVYYPAKLQGVYQAAQNMASSHLCESCQCIDDPLKGELKSLRERRDTASGGKQYWADGARALGLFEAEDGLRLTREGSAAQQQQQ